MILGHSELKKLIKTDNLITGLSERDLKDPEGCVFDLQLEKVFTLEGKTFLGIDERELANVVEIATFNSKTRSSYIFKPGTYHVVKTVEEVNLPEDICALFVPRSTLFRSGLVLRTGMANPGYHGPLYFGLHNAGPIEVEIEMGARIASVYFMKVTGKAENTYRGQWQGGRDTTKGREKQI